MTGFPHDQAAGVPADDVPEADLLDQERAAWDDTTDDPERPVADPLPSTDDIDADPADVIDQARELPEEDDPLPEE